MDEDHEFYTRRFTWKVTDFSSICENECLDSPTFKCLNKNSNLRLHPNGTADHKGVVLLRLMTEHSSFAFSWFEIAFEGVYETYSVRILKEFYDEADEIKVKPGGKFFRFAKLKDNENSMCASMDTNHLHEKKANIFPDDVLTVSCEVYVSTNFREKVEKFIGFVNNMKMSSANQELLSLSRDLENAFNNTRFADVILRVGIEEFRAHKMILMSRSKVFEGMFDSDMKESKENVVEMVGMEASTVRTMLQYMYTGRTDELSMAEAIDLYATSDRYDIAELKGRCKVFILNKIDEESVCDVAVLAQLHCDEDLGKAARRVLKENLKKILKSQKWRQFAKENPVLYAELIESTVLEDNDGTGAKKSQETNSQGGFRILPDFITRSFFATK